MTDKQLRWELRWRFWGLGLGLAMGHDGYWGPHLVVGPLNMRLYRSRKQEE